MAPFGGNTPFFGLSMERFAPIGAAVVQEHFKNEGVPTAVHYPIPLNRQLEVKGEQLCLPVGDAIATRVMSLPMHLYLNEHSQRFIINTFKESLSV